MFTPLVLLALGCRHHPEVCEPVEETPYDGRDQDCDGLDLDDVDDDGHIAEEVGGDDCDDENASISPSAVEVAYDGLDQDCDGADLVDVDGDGHAALEAGGEDCDDTDAKVSPSAEEVPYDGADQDCDGSDLVDVDGDGHAATEAGGEDCDDQDALTWPGAPEIKDNDRDEDCDSLTDEYLVCAEGIADFSTIQLGVDGVPERSLLELCPGTYREQVVVDGKKVEIVGGGEHPNDVVIGDWSEPAGFLSDQEYEEEELVVRYVTFRPGTSKSQLKLQDVESVTLEFVEIECQNVLNGTGDEEVEVYTNNINIASSRFTGTECRINVYSSSREPAGLAAGESPRIVDFVANIVQSDKMWMGLRGPSRVTNSMFVSDYIVLSLSADQERPGAFEVLHNLISQAQELAMISVSAWEGAAGTSTWSVTNNIVESSVFGESSDYYGTAFWWFYWQGEDSVGSIDLTEALPDDFASNLLWSVDGDLGYVSYAESYCWPGECFVEMEVSEELSEGCIWNDPQFVDVVGTGSYTLAEGSPGVDAGVGKPDADGSPADVGPFGGPFSEWWREVPWQLP